MKHEVNSNRFEILNHFEKSFRLHGDFTAAISKPFFVLIVVVKAMVHSIVSDSKNIVKISSWGEDRKTD